MDWLKQLDFNIDPQTIYILLGSGSLLLVLQYVLEYRRALTSVGYVHMIYFSLLQFWFSDPVVSETCPDSGTCFDHSLDLRT
jgi:hypothetical protein